MNKDVIYIDVEDDVTAIIGKIKASKERIVALVPPKRIGALQSAVNLRLLARIAGDSDKRLVIITNNKALIALSSSAKIPIARNLQSKPEIAEIAALEIDDGDDVIDGIQLPVGELEKTADSVKVKDKKADEEDEVDEAIETIDVEEEPQSSKSTKKNIIKVPDFSRFRKKLFIGGLLGVLLVTFLVWATQTAPSAKIIITAKTEPAPVSMSLKLGGATATDVTKGIIQTITKQIKKDVSVEFTATGKETVGEKATGTLTLSNEDDGDPISVPSGSVFSNGDYEFVTTASAVVPGADVVNHEIVAGTMDVSVIASEVGAEYNLPAGSYDSSVAGLTADGGPMVGGSSHEATIVTAADVQKASQALVELSSDSVKQQLIKQFTSSESVINDSFNIDRAAAVSVPAIGAEATAKAKLTSATTFSITAIAKSELQTYLKSAINKQIDKDSQRIYDDGIDKVTLSGYLKNDTEATVNIATSGRIGPNIDKASIKNQVKGKHYGDVQALVESIEGVSNVDIKFSYFWVTTVPNDVNKIDVEFTLKDA